jgi:glutathione synthase/RimK-type ligase-like ATP-grasp enzyme
MEVYLRKLDNSNIIDTCLIPKKIFNRLGLAYSTLYIIKFGQLSELIYVTPHEQQNEIVYLPSLLFDRLIPYENLRANIWNDERHIYLGPVIGIFDTPRILSRLNNNNPRFYDIEYMKGSKFHSCLCYYFSIDNIDWKEHKIKGITFQKETNTWEWFWFPIPNVIYDKGIFLTDTLKPAAKQLREKLREDYNIHFINSKNSLNKWELCHRLSKYDEIKKYIPLTIIYKSFNDVLEMLNKYNFIFIKSFYGSKGSEVLSIQIIDNNFKLNYYDKSDMKLKEILLYDKNELKAFIDSFIKDKKFIVQKGISLVKHNKSYVDIRIMLMKNRTGNWTILYEYARIAKNGSTITSASTGGEIAIYEKIYPFLSSQLLKDKLPTIDAICDVAIRIANYIDKEFGLFGEIGIDIGIDMNGDIWIFEANAKPGSLADNITFGLNGDTIYKAMLRYKTDLNNYYIKSFEVLDNISPRSLAIFEYSKFLVDYY